MFYLPVTDQQGIADAFETVSTNWKRGSFSQQAHIGFPGVQDYPEYQNGTYTIWWRSQEEIWALFLPKYDKMIEVTHLFLVGIDNTSHNIDSQFVVAEAGFNRRLGRIFLQDCNGHKYLGHTGQIGGGKRGVGRKGFLEYCERNGIKTVNIKWPDDKKTRGFCVDKIDSDQLPKRIREFTETRLAFRRWIMEYNG